MSERPVVVVVAAGRSSRFAGVSHKLVQRLGDSTVLGTTLAQVMESRLPCLVVVTPQRQPLGVITPLDLLYSFDHREFQTSFSDLWRTFRQSEWDQAELWKTRSAELERLVQNRTRQLEEQRQLKKQRTIKRPASPMIDKTKLKLRRV